MADRKRIAILIGQADEEYQARFIEGFTSQTTRADIDVCVFSMYRKYQSSDERELGESNIYQLVNYDLFDGIVFMKDTIQSTGVADRLEEEIHEVFSGPVIAVEQESKYFDSVCTDGYSPIVELVSHLIEEHGYEDIAFLTGKKWHPHSKQRLNAYKEAMTSHGLEVTDDRIVYGDFWYKSGELCAEQLLSSKRGLPEAIACANDQMAIGVCDALTSRGYNIPEDVAVVGFDSTEEGRKSPVPLTSAIVAAKHCGVYAAEYIIAKLAGMKIGEFKGKAEIVTGPSCGCRDGILKPLPDIRDEWGTDLSEDGFYSINNFMCEDLITQTNLMGFLSTTYTYAYQLGKIGEFHFCLQESWRDMDVEEAIHCKNDGYDKHMIDAVRYNGDGTDGMVQLEEKFETKNLLPGLGKTDEPATYFFTPVFNEDECFGYAVVRYEDPTRSFDRVYRRWISLLAVSLESLRRRCAIHIADIKSREAKKFNMVLAVEQLVGEEKEECDTVKRILDENLFEYHFQPIVSVATGEIYSYEALMRSKTDKRISPLGIIKYAGMMGRLGDIERATFVNVLNLVSEHPEVFKDKKVFINSIPGVKLDEGSYAKMDELLTKHADTVVVELTEEAEFHDEELGRLKEYFDDRGIETAVDDYGTGYSNVSNLLRYMPNYVKIDRALLSDIQNRPQKQYFVREIIDFCHNNEILALAEGVETSEELRMVIHLGADLIQGYYTAKPAPGLAGEIGKSVKAEILKYEEEKKIGLTKRTYKAGRTVRVPINNLTKEGYTEIVVGEDNPVCRDVTFTGTPGMSTDIHMRIVSGYTGILTMENVSFSNAMGKPGVELGDNCDVTIILRGENVFRRGGILVPESSRLTIEGSGDLKICPDAEEFYGIGNDLNSKHGEIVFNQDGEVYIESTGRNGVCIGSGLGGPIGIHRGRYCLEVNSDRCVGVGAMTGDVDLLISDCAFITEFSLFTGVCIGSMEGSLNLILQKSSIKCTIGGNSVVAIGTAAGKSAKVHIESVGVVTNVRGDNSTTIGSLTGNTDISLSFTGLRMDGRGKDAVVFGGLEGYTHVEMCNSDALIRMQTEASIDDVTRRDIIKLEDARCQCTINDQEIDVR